jgi:hypothetical protein
MRSQANNGIKTMAYAQRACNQMGSSGSPAPQRPSEPVIPEKIEKLERLTREENWDLEGGRPVSERLWAEAKRFYVKVRRAAHTWIEPHISASGDGSVHFTWIRNEKRANLELDERHWHLAVKESPESGYRRCAPTPDEAVAQLRAFLS